MTPTVAATLRALRLGDEDKPKVPQAALARALGVTPGHLSRMERGEKQPPLDQAEAWAHELGMRLAVVPLEAADVAEIKVLEPALRDLLLRLARLLPNLPPVLVRDLTGRVEAWSEDYSDEASSATSQDSRASVR